jgi:sec-independent protein translocase protein TatA
MIGGLGVQELIIVLVIALFVFGGKRLPEVGQSLGKAIRGFKEGSEKGLDEETESKRKAEKSAKEEQTSETPASEATETPASEDLKKPVASSQESGEKDSSSG